jgi:hypothetical protein
MDENVTLTLSKPDVAQILDGLYQRLETWKYTEHYLQTGYVDERYCVEECSDAEEAHGIAERYDSMINSIEQQAYDGK